jgi:D-serine deaminase-like pyridoxal phosphate-dependent protein
MNWFELQNADAVPSPALLLFPDRIETNLHRMLSMVGAADRLRPHMKTHKLPELIRLQVQRGVTKFKCATIAEAEMTASCGALHVLLAYQPVGPNVSRFLNLLAKFPSVRFACVADHPDAITALAAAAREAGQRIEVLVDLDVGQHRTGISPDDGALALYRQIVTEASLIPGGLHAYDGHIHDTDLASRQAAADAAFSPVQSLRQRIVQAGWPVPRVIAGGTPTFPIHAKRAEVECSPGTCVLWDAGYAAKLPDLDFLTAAVLLTRVVSKPAPNRLCLDLGHKAVASEMPHPRVIFLNLKDAQAVSHSEEHLVVETPEASTIGIGQCVYGVPWHICPTVALHSQVMIVRDNVASGQWEVTARRRMLTV